ncbi:MAG: YbaB/EbfC family nucleoid-associated protein [Christensenellales bacterium]
MKENYFVLIQTIQENVKKSHVDLKDELGFDLEDTSNHTNIEQMVNELIANVNRIADKMNENTNNINNINNEITTINEINHIQEENINKVFAKIEQINLNNKNDIYDKMFDDVQTQIDDLKNSEDAIKEDLSKMKQLVKPNNENKEMTKQVETKTEAAVEKVQTEYTRPKEEPRVVETNETKTLQRIKNVYDIRIVERILHEARELECREEKARLIHAWSKLEDKVGYVLAPVAKILLDGKMVANGKHEILIVYPSATICNHLMEPKNYVDAKQVLRITFGKDYDFLALPENTWQEKRSEYIGQYGVGIKYPKLSPIHNPELNVVTVNYNQMNTLPKKPLQQAKAFFGSAISRRGGKINDESSNVKKNATNEKDMERTQEEIMNTEFKTTCGPVTVIVMGDRNLKQIIFEEGFEANTKDDLEMLADMIVAATRQAGDEIDQFTAEKMSKYQSLLGGF